MSAARSSAPWARAQARRSARPAHRAARTCCRTSSSSAPREAGRRTCSASSTPIPTSCRAPRDAFLRQPSLYVRAFLVSPALPDRQGPPRGALAGPASGPHRRIEPVVPLAPERAGPDRAGRAPRHGSSCSCATRPRGPLPTGRGACASAARRARSARRSRPRSGLPMTAPACASRRDKRVNDPLVVRRGIYQPQLERWQHPLPARAHPGHPERALVPGPDRRSWRRSVTSSSCRARHACPGSCATATSPTSPYDPDVLERLRDFYRPHNAALAEYLGMDLDWDAR